MLTRHPLPTCTWPGTCKLACMHALVCYSSTCTSSGSSSHSFSHSLVCTLCVSLISTHTYTTPTTTTPRSCCIAAAAAAAAAVCVAARVQCTFAALVSGSSVRCWYQRAHARSVSGVNAAPISAVTRSLPPSNVLKAPQQVDHTLCTLDSHVRQRIGFFLLQHTKAEGSRSLRQVCAPIAARQHAHTHTRM